VPEPESTVAAFDAAQAANDKHPKGSKERKAAWAALTKLYKAYEDVLVEDHKQLKIMQVAVPTPLMGAQLLEASARLCEEALMRVAKMTHPGSTAMNAAFFELANDCTAIAGHAAKVQAALRAVMDKCTDGINELKDRKSNNDKWIAWAANGPEMEAAAVKKNRTATKPR
jgi:hypothetical protein